MGRRPRAVLVVLALAVAAPAAAGCGEDDAAELRDRAAGELREQRDRVRAELERRRDQVRKRIREVLGRLEQAVPQARRTSPTVQARGRTGTTTIDAFLTDVITSVDRYWTRTLSASGLPEPRVRYVWVPPGDRILTACRTLADDNAAFYCPGDDTIYVGQRFAAGLHEGAVRGLPGERAGGRAAGDFGVAYVVAHEYAHNLQNELGLFRIGRSNSAKPFELQADCMAGAWGNSVFRQGELEPGDIEEALNTALAVGDFDVGNEQHHGRPEERRDAWLAGFRDGDPSVCRGFIPEA